MGVELQAAVAKLKAARGTNEQWLEREVALTRFIADLSDGTRVFCRGEVRIADRGHFPAVLTYNPIYRQTLAWAPSDRKNGMEAHHVAFFHSTMPHVCIARDVLYDNETSVVASTDIKEG